jgi:hypothetical protein
MVKTRKVRVSTSTGTTHFVNVSAGETGGVLRAKVALRLGRRPNDVVLTTHGKVINDEDVFTMPNMFGSWGAYLPWCALGGVVGVAVVASMFAKATPVTY